MIDIQKLKALAEAATPQDFDSAEEKIQNGHIECPHCGGQGEVEMEADYCNYDDVAIGVQFYGIGNEFGAAEAYYRAAKPAALLELIAENESLRKNATRYEWLRNEHTRPGCLSSDPDKARWLNEYLMCGDQLDAAIDEQLAKAKQS